jgi:hypothetical protein
MMRRNGVSGLVASGLLVIGIIVGAVSFYVATTEFVPAHTSTGQRTTTAVLSQSSSETTSASVCAASPPLALSRVTVTKTVTGAGLYTVTTYGLSMVWKNCSNQQISFKVRLYNFTSSPFFGIAKSVFGNLNVTTTVLGTTSQVWGNLGGCVSSSCGVVRAYGVVTEDFSIQFPGGISPNAIVASISGSATALDPVTGQPLSPSTAFTALPAA